MLHPDTHLLADFCLLRRALYVAPPDLVGLHDALHGIAAARRHHADEQEVLVRVHHRRQQPLAGRHVGEGREVAWLDHGEGGLLLVLVEVDEPDLDVHARRELLLQVRHQLLADFQHMHDAQNSGVVDRAPRKDAQAILVHGDDSGVQPLVGGDVRHRGYPARAQHGQAHPLAPVLHGHDPDAQPQALHASHLLREVAAQVAPQAPLGDDALHGQPPVRVRQADNDPPGAGPDDGAAQPLLARRALLEALEVHRRQLEGGGQLPDPHVQLLVPPSEAAQRPGRAGQRPGLEVALLLGPDVEQRTLLREMQHLAPQLLAEL
mmetsp:Transcript_60601/g.195207  ORF Transcript_60601/g.195207 Transcript_60601/m.195207 type:complete len:320 (-) Transcript_60601:415-1374(-)